MAIIPTQERFIDPYENIITKNVINKQFSVVFGNKGLVDGLLLTVMNENTFQISSGSCIVDTVFIEYPNDIICELNNLNYTAGDENVVYIYYRYELKTPINVSSIDMVKTTNFVNDDKHLILGFIRLDSSGHIIDITNESNVIPGLKREEQIFIRYLKEEYFNDLWHGNIDSDLWMKHYKIINVGTDASSITDPLDLVNKAYVDQQVSTIMSTDEKVKVDNNDWQNGYLDDKLQVDSVYLTKSVNGSSGSNKTIILTKTDHMVKVTSADSAGIFIREED